MRMHVKVLVAVAIVAAALSAIVWLHPTLGFPTTGILAGEDMRLIILAEIWGVYGVSAILGTLGVFVGKRFTQRWTALAAAYAGTIAAVAFSIAVIRHA